MSADTPKPLPPLTDDEFLVAESVPEPADEPQYRPRLIPAPEAVPAGPLFKDDFVLAATSDSDDGIEYLQLKPPDGLSPVQRRILTMNPIPLTEEVEEERPLTQFTLQEMMVLTTFLSVGLSIMYYFPPDMVAGVLGLLALVGQGLLMRFPPENRHIRLAAWVLLGMYAVAAATAFLQHILI